MRKLVAKGLYAPVSYSGHGHRWPRDRVTEVEVSDEVADAILADPHLVAIEVAPAQLVQNAPTLAELPALAPKPKSSKPREA